MARLIVERDQGVDLRPELVTFSELQQRWLDAKRGDLADSTAATYETLLSVHLLPLLGRMKVRDIKPLHVENAKAAVTRRGKSRKSALNVFRLLDAILKQAVRWQLIIRNPCDAVDAPRPRRFVPHTPTPEELSRLIEVADATPYGLVVRLALLTGARHGELLRLCWRHVDWDAGSLSIPGTKTRGSFRILELANEQFRCYAASGRPSVRRP